MKHYTHMRIEAAGEILWSGLIENWEESHEDDDIAEIADRLRDGEMIDIGGGAAPVLTLIPVR